MFLVKIRTALWNKMAENAVVERILLFVSVVYRNL